MEDNKVPLSWSWVGEGRGLLLEDSSGGANYAVGESRCRQWSWGVSQQVVGCGRFLHLQNKLKLQVFFIMLLVSKKSLNSACTSTQLFCICHNKTCTQLSMLHQGCTCLRAGDNVMLHLLLFMLIKKKEIYFQCTNLLLLSVHFSFITAII